MIVAGLPGAEAALQRKVNRHVGELLACRLCPKMHKPPVSGRPVISEVFLVGQAPGDKEPKMGRPFAWTAGKMLFRWFREQCGVEEETFRQRVYMAAVCRCFPGKLVPSGDRVPDEGEIQNCSRWMEAEIKMLRPKLVLPVGKLAIQRFLPPSKLDAIIGKSFRVEKYGVEFDVIPLPHPSGASPWPRMEPGKTLLAGALRQVRNHEAFASINK